MKRIYLFIFSIISLLIITEAKAQLVNLEVEIIQVSRTNYTDCGGCGQPDPTWKINSTINTSPVVDNTCIHVPSNNTLLTPVSVLLSNRPNTNATSFTLGFEGFEKNCENTVCTFTPYNFFTCAPSVFGDSRRCLNPNIANVNFRTFAPCTWHTQTTSFCGDYAFTYRFRWSFNQPPAIAVQPSPANNILCPTDNINLIVTPTTANGWPTGSNYQWQVATVTDCANVSASNWSNVGGANAATFTPPNTPGTRLYRVLISANCASNFSSNTVASNCVRVTYNPLAVPGDLPPPIQSGICGSIVLPGSSHPLSVLLPPAAGAVNGVTYSWAATGGTFNNNTSSNVVWTAPTTPGNYSITVTYIDACTQADAFTTCVVDVGSPDCDFAYVATTGTDDVFAGGPDNPYRTLAYALTQLNGRTYVRMAGGTYNESAVINMQNNLVIEGGYQFAAGIWTKISNQTTTLILSGFHNSTFTGSTNIEHRVGIYSNNASNWALQDLTIFSTDVAGTTPSNRGRSNYAVLIQNNSSNYNIIRCSITSGAASRGANGVTPGASGGGAGGSGAGGGGIGQNGSGDPSGGANGGSGVSAAFSAAIHPPYIFPAGANGAGGAGGVGTDNCGAGPGCGFFGPSDGGCNGGNGANGSIGADGRSWQVNDRPNAALANVAHFLPLGQSGSGQDGGGGGQAAGGNGSRGGQSAPACIDCDGRNGGVGGAGGAGGRGGSGGYGSGGSFAIYTHNSNTGSNFQNVSLNIPATEALGGIGAAGSAGVNGLVGTPGACNGCVLPGQRCSGAGGTGARGGNGGRGRDGANGINAHLVVNGVASNPSTSIPNFPVVSIAYNNSKACINSEITLVKDGPNSWTLPLPFVNDVSGAPAPLTTSSYSNGSTTVQVYSNTPGQLANMQVGGAVFTNYLRIADDNRALPVIDVNPSNISCVGGTVDLSATSWGTEVEFDWRIYQGNNVNSPSLTPSTLQSPTFDLTGLPSGLYTVRYRVREICCGWSIPVYDTLRIQDLPTQFFVSGGGGFCPGSAGAVVILSGSEPGVSYVLLANGAPVDTIIGSGAPLSFAPQNLSGNYTVFATRFTDCERLMLGNVNIFEEPVPNEFNITGGGLVCAQGANSSTLLGLDGSQFGVTYQLFLNGINPVGPQISGTGNPISFGPINVAGTYTVTATFVASGCTRVFTDSVTVNVAPGPTPYAISGGGTYCDGEFGVPIFMVQSDTLVTYQLLWNYTVPINTPVQSIGDSIYFGLANIDGNYSVIATDQLGCQSIMSDTVQVTKLTSPVISSIIVENVTCSGSATGNIIITVIGGAQPLTYEWTDAASNVVSNAEDLLNVVAGTYTLTVTDISGCTVTLTETIIENQPIAITNVTSQPTSCQGASNGGFTITATGGRAPYYFSVNNGPIQLGNTFTNLSQGSYTITVSDADGCTATAIDSIQDGLPFELVVDSQSGALCAGQNNGEVVLTPVNGTAPFEYSTNGIIFNSNNVFSGLAAGTYTFFARDAAGCLATVTITFQNVTPVTITLIRKSDVSCFGGNDGSIGVSVSGGTASYDIVWNPGGMDTPFVDSLIAGNYTISVTDANGCTSESSYNIAEPNEIVSTMSITQPECVGKQNGLALVGVNGGTTPYSFEWNTTPVQFGVLANQLEGGQTYLVTITDGKGCTKIDTAVVENPDPIEVNTVPSSVSCFAGSNGEVVIEVIGGSAPYTYELNGIYQTDSIYTGLTGGNYVVFVEDNKGCVASTTFSISTISDLEVDLTGNGVSNLLRAVRGQEIQLQANLVNASSSTIIAGYIWNASNNLDLSDCPDPDDCSNPSMAPLDNDFIVVYAKEIIGNDTCLVSDTLRIDVSQDFKVFIPNAFSPNKDAQCINEHFEINIMGAENLDIRIFNRWGEQVFHNPTQQNGPEDPNDNNCDNPRGAWDGTFKGQPVPIGAYIYQLVVTYFDGTEQTINGTVTVIR